MDNAVSTVGTVTLNSKVVIITGNMGISNIAVKYVSGTVTYSGTNSISDSEGNLILSSEQTLDTDGFEFSAPNAIDGFTIDASAGTCILSFSN